MEEDKLLPFYQINGKLFANGKFLSADAKWLYATLKSFKNLETGECYPSYTKIIRRGGFTSRTQIARALAELEKFSWVTWKKRFPTKKNSVYDYTLTEDAPYVFTRDEDGNQIAADDQTCPRKEQARQFRKEWRDSHAGNKMERFLEDEKVKEQTEIIDDEIPF